ncbi:efflux transporter outer membrane subunit [Marinomonas algarum]|uniref:Efflux transporter outer membrane subunit n=1 Tax=Marinomonas algarum TaxID=2883105 RepID=A0A9X1IL71_9GAMM|nr:efflux transporter outer membrane subunit [Marinomonas algarum]MCB5161255.1 efflux transporter outer membrane subunit [Marinomonas algarum]
MMKLLKMAPFILLTGCAAVGPDWEAPTAELENTFVSGEGSSINDVAYQAWWREFTDPTLTALVEKGFEQNLSILQAKERIREANALLRETGINSALDGSLSYNRLRAGGENVSTSTSSSASLDAEFVIDLFGGIRREQEAAQSYLAATQADIGTERLAWLAELIEKYADARYYQKAAQLTAATINTRQDTLAITQKQLDNGLSTQYELAEIKASLQTAQADLPGYQAQYQAAIFALATLMDEPAKQILAMMSSSTDQLTLPTTIATGIPADLLRNRPDIRYYEAVLHQQVAKTGVEESDLYPSIRLTGSVSHANSADGWSFGPSISLGLFNRGLLKAQRDAQISAANQAEIDWRSSVLDAVEDVQVAQSNFTLYMQQSDLLKQAAESYSTALELGHNNFKNGAMTLLDLLDTVRSEASTQISAASARNTALQEWTALQIAIGAGAGFADVDQDQDQDQEQANKSPLDS